MPNVFIKQVINSIFYRLHYENQNMKTLSVNILLGEAKLGTDESAFNAILATRSWAHLRQLMAEYQTMRGHSLEQAVAREFSANAEKGLLAICKTLFVYSSFFFFNSFFL